MLDRSLNCTVNKQPRLFPKLFIADAAISFKSFIKKHGYNYSINYIADRSDLLSVIETYSQFKNYNLPVIISDISFLKKKDQSLLLKFMDDSNLNIILLASRDNILDTIVSRVKDFRKFYNSNKGNQAGFINISKAREMFNNDIGTFDEDTSYEDRLVVYNKYNPLLSYDDSLVSSYRKCDREKLISLLEYNNK